MTGVRTVTLNGTQSVPLVDISDPSTLIYNQDPNNTVWISDADSRTAGDAYSVPLPPNGVLVVNPSEVDPPVSYYGIAQTGQTAVVSVIPGGVSFFQLVKIVTKSLVINSTAPGNGLFVYSGIGALGNPPVYAVEPPGGTVDPYGNTGLLEGATSYSGSGAVQVDNGGVLFYGAAGTAGYNSPGNPGEISSVAATAILALNSPVTPAQQATGVTPATLSLDSGNPPLIIASFIAGKNSAGVGNEVPHTPVLNANFAAGGTSPRYWREVNGTNGGSVRMDGAINITGAVAANTAMFNLPAAVRPSRQLGFAGQVCNSAGLVLGAAVVQINTSGDVVLVPATAAGKFVLLDGINFGLN